MHSQFFKVTFNFVTMFKKITMQCMEMLSYFLLRTSISDFPFYE